MNLIAHWTQYGQRRQRGGSKPIAKVTLKESPWRKYSRKNDEGQIFTFASLYVRIDLLILGRAFATLCFFSFNPVIWPSVLVRNCNDKDMIFFNRTKQFVRKPV